MKIYLDIDGVLADFVSHICNAHRIESPYKQKQNLGHYDIEKLSLMQFCRFWDPCREGGFWAGMPKLADGEIFFDSLQDLDVCLVTSLGIYTCPDYPFFEYITKGRTVWLMKHFNKLYREGKFCFVPNYKDVLASPDSILIDDNPEEVNRFEAAGGNAILFPRPWNSLYQEKDPLSFVVSELNRIIKALGFNYDVNIAIPGGAPLSPSVA